MAFINFNYDRCLEHYLFHAVKRAFSVDDAAAARVMAGMPVIHPYGQIGALPWQSGIQAHPFGGDDLDLRGLSQEILTYTEQTTGARHLASIPTLVNSASKIVFLGFGFHKQNMQILDRSNPQIVPSVLGTALQESPGNLTVYRDLLGQHLKATAMPPELVDTTCDQFINAWGKFILNG